jgi:predicted nucleotidyltransferase
MRAVKQRRQQCEELRQEVLSATIAALNKLVTRGEAYVYGSVARPGRFGGRSDVDSALTEAPTGMSVYRLQARLEEMIGRPVYLCILDETRVAPGIVREGVLWTR